MEVTNIAMMSGIIISDFEFDHEAFGEKYYMANLLSKRLSEKEDRIKIMVSERLTGIKECKVGDAIRVAGQFRSFNICESGKRHLKLFLFVTEIERMENIEYANSIFLDGFLCKEANHRTTPLGREIADITLAVNRDYGKTDYLPCICWGRNAAFAGTLDVGTRLRINGRMQSRKYEKRVSETETETRTAYEVSIWKMEVCDNDEEEG